MAEQARPSTDAPEPRRRVPRLDEIEWFALALIAAGMVLVAWNAWLEPPTALGDAVARSAPNWAPGLVTDGILLWVVNGIFRRHERKRVLSQMGSLSREFALDAVRRSREEQWLHDGSLAGQVLSRAALQTPTSHTRRSATWTCPTPIWRGRH